MKTRFGFVSNSSSSSFLVMYNDLSDFDELKQICSAELEKEFGVFFGDVKDCPVKDAMYFLSSLYGSILREYALDRDFDFNLGFEKLPREKFDAICKTMNCDVEGIKPIIEKGIALVEKYDSYDMLDFDDIEELGNAFAKAVFATAQQKWKYFSSFSYSDEDGDFWSYMEHDFMDYVDEYQKDNYGLLILNEH